MEGYRKRKQPTNSLVKHVINQSRRCGVSNKRWVRFDEGIITDKGRFRGITKTGDGWGREARFCLAGFELEKILADTHLIFTYLIHHFMASYHRAFASCGVVLSVLQV
jgi:hypothetical protein